MSKPVSIDKEAALKAAPPARALGAQVEAPVPFGTSYLDLTGTSPIQPPPVKQQSLTEEQRRELLKGKRVIVTGAGHVEKQFILDRIIELGCKVILVDSADCYAKSLPIEHFVPVDMLNPDTAAEEAIAKLKALNLEFDAIYNFWEDNVAYYGIIGTALGLRCNSEESALTARSKNRTREAMRKAGLPTPVSILCKTTQDMEEAVKKCPFPAVVKPVYGASAMGAVKVTNAEEALRAFQRNQELLTPEFDAIYAQGADCLLEQYLDGNEVDVDLLLQDGQLKFWSITDNLATLEPSFVNTGSNMPSVLPESKQLELVQLAYNASVKAIGLRYGVAHVEAKYTTNSGPQIVEVNGRIGGNPYPWWVKTVWGVDLVEQSLMVACGIPIEPKKAKVPLCALAMTFILSSKEGQLTQTEADLFGKLCEDPRIYEMEWEVPMGHQYHVNGEECLGFFTAQGKTMKEAISIYLELTDKNKFPLPDDLWIAGAELLPIQLIEDEAQRERRSSIVHHEQNKRFEADVQRASSRNVLSTQVSDAVLSSSPMPTGSGFSSMIGTRKNSISLQDSVRPTHLNRSDSMASVSSQTSVGGISQQLQGLSTKSKSQHGLSGKAEEAAC